MINSLEIENIKGIDRKVFNLSISHNKPTLLVAPNGFGKSSIASAFNSIKNNRIDLNKDDFYQGSEDNLPRMSIRYTDKEGVEKTVVANSSSSSIKSDFGIFVIRNFTKPKGKGSIGGRTSAYLDIPDIVLVKTIPERVNFSYRCSDYKRNFGTNGKILPNIKNILENKSFINKISYNYGILENASKIRVLESINEIVSVVNCQEGSAADITNWLGSNKIDDFRATESLIPIHSIIKMFYSEFSDLKIYLIAIQVIWLFNENKTIFKKCCKFINYKLDKEKFDSDLGSFNCTWKDIKTVESNNKLLIKFPKAVDISNGQRDILVFLSMIFQAERELKKENNILVIDEVFDYLDDANLIAAQYFITKFIATFKSQERRIYPLILTHINPEYFKNFAFSNMKVYFLNKSSIDVSQSMKKLLRKRSDNSIEEDVSKFLLHYHPENINKRQEFSHLNLPATWGEGNNFLVFANNEVVKYFNNEQFDPFAVCAALRVKIEEKIYGEIQSQEFKNEFLSTHKTRSKLDKAKEGGVSPPESYYLLGIIYNEGMHWRDNKDNISPIASKLENLVIKNMIKEIFD